MYIIKIYHEKAICYRSFAKTKLHIGFKCMSRFRIFGGSKITCRSP